MSDMKDRAREYLRTQTQLNGGGLFHCNILNLILGFAEQETKELEKENAELKLRICMSVECSEAQKNGELCLGYGGDEDEPCERCKNCIKCEGGYYQLGETEKDNQLTKAKKIIKKLSVAYKYIIQCNTDANKYADKEILAEAEQFIKE